MNMNQRSRVLLVDDDHNLLKLLSIRLGAAGYEVGTADSGENALAQIAAVAPRVLVIDLRMEGMDGMTLFDIVHERHPALPVIVLTAHGTIPEAVEATKRGVFTFLTKPFDSKVLLEYVEKACRINGFSDEAAAGESEWRRDIISRSAAMEEVLNQARIVAASDTSLLIQSESGAGKELLARAIHLASPRAHKPFMAVNCSAIPEALLESELFGHSKGSFTGAVKDHKGLFQAAEGGTVFLDEIGDMPLALQAKLLRVLQEREVRPVGSTLSLPVNVRIVSATHRNLEELAAAGQFREDLYYRLNVVQLDIPPLRDRPEDIPLLANHFLGKINHDNRKPARGFSPEAMECLISAPWPGNVRQLYNVVEQTVTLSTTSVIPVSLVQKALRHKTGTLPSLAAARRDFERDYLTRLLQMTEGNVTQAARFAQRNRTELYKLLRRYHLDPEEFRNLRSTDA